MEKQTIAQIKELLQSEDLTSEILLNLRLDRRKGVKNLLKQYDTNMAVKEEKKKKFLKLKAFDQAFRTEVITHIAGVDEAGRGPLAGPVVTAAVILPKDIELIGITDSKQLSEKERDYFFQQIKEQAIAYHIEIISAEEIDQMNILEATRQAMTKSVLAMQGKLDLALTDALDLYDTRIPYEAIIKGDDRSLAIAAASVLAKVTRDRLMEEYDELYPQYGFKQHKGYGTKLHLDAMKQYGITPIHRKSFRPVRACME